MISQKFGSHLVVYESFKSEKNPEILTFLETSDFSEILDKLTSPTIIVLGGDGSMLSAIREFHHLGYDFLGIHFGTKGFLMNYISELDDDFERMQFPLLENHLHVCDGEKSVFYAFNEIDIRAGNGRIITLEIELGESLLQIAGDGIILSTPSGSTGYNSSLGGPIIPHDIGAFVLTPKASWNPKGQTPILFSQNTPITFRNIGRKNTLEVYADSHHIYTGTGESLQIISKKSDTNITFLIPKKYLSNWKNRLMKEQGFLSKQKSS